TFPASPPTGIARPPPGPANSSSARRRTGSGQAAPPEPGDRAQARAAPARQSRRGRGTEGVAAKTRLRQLRGPDGAAGDRLRLEHGDIARGASPAPRARTLWRRMNSTLRNSAINGVSRRLPLLR